MLVEVSNVALALLALLQGAAVRVMLAAAHRQGAALRRVCGVLGSMQCMEDAREADAVLADAQQALAVAVVVWCWALAVGLFAMARNRAAAAAAKAPAAPGGGEQGC